MRATETTLNNDEVLPIGKGIDVISVGTSFLRFLEIAEKIQKQVAVVMDNDGDFENKIKKKYENYSESDYGVHQYFCR